MRTCADAVIHYKASEAHTLVIRINSLISITLFLAMRTVVTKHAIWVLNGLTSTFTQTGVVIPRNITFNMCSLSNRSIIILIVYKCWIAHGFLVLIEDAATGTRIIRLFGATQIIVRKFHANLHSILPVTGFIALAGALVKFVEDIGVVKHPFFIKKIISAKKSIFWHVMF